MVRDAVFGTAGAVIVGVALWYTSALLMDPKTPAEAKQLAMAFWGIAIGKSIDFFFRGGKK